MMTRNVVNLSQEYDVLIDRRTKWGNPFGIGFDGDRETVIAKHRAYLYRQIKANNISLEELAALDGKILGCHCAPLACHGDNLVEAAHWAATELKKRKSNA